MAFDGCRVFGAGGGAAKSFAEEVEKWGKVIKFAGIRAD